MTTSDPADEGQSPGASDPSEPVRRGRDGRRLSPVALANLQPGAGRWRKGDAPALKHGARTTRPQTTADWGPAVAAVIADLEEIVGDELRDPYGEVQPWARPSIEVVAVQRCALMRLERYVADRENRGALEPGELETMSRVAGRYHDSLAREALTLTSRIEATGAARDLTQAFALDAQLEAAELRIAELEAQLAGRKDVDGS